MALLLRSVARTEIARSLYRDIYNENDLYYFFAGRTAEWDDEASPPTPVDSRNKIAEANRNKIFLTRVEASDAVLVIDRRNWTSGTVYDQYDDDYSSTRTSYSGSSTLDGSTFYVMTDEFNVYKCIYNNSNAQSTVKPTGTGTETIETADGYIWKFMFQVPVADQSKFLTTEYIPVRKVTGAGDPEFDVNGIIDSVTIDDGGSGYTTAPTVIVNGDGTGAVITATLTAGVVTALSIDNAGSGYTFAYITFTDENTGSGAEASVTLGGTETDTIHDAVESAATPGTIDRIEVVSGGLDYVDGDAEVTISGDGSGAVATPTIDSDTGAITSITITNQGSGYSYADITITQTSGTGSGVSLRSVISPRGGHGSNSQKELFATDVMLSVNLDNDNTDQFLNNDYRQLGLIKNPYAYGTSSVYTTSSATCCYIVNVNSATYTAMTTAGYDSEVSVDSDTNSSLIYVYTQDPGDGTYNIYLLPINDPSSFSSSDTLTIGGTSGYAINSVANPEVGNQTGEIIYLDNRELITRQADQVEKIRAILKF